MLLGLLEVDAQAIRANKKGQLAYISRRRGLVCLGLLDVNAQALKARQDGATCIHFKTLKQFLCPGLLDVNAQAITSNKMGAACIHIPRRGKHEGEKPMGGTISLTTPTPQRSALVDASAPLARRIWRSGMAASWSPVPSR